MRKVAMKAIVVPVLMLIGFPAVPPSDLNMVIQTFKARLTMDMYINFWNAEEAYKQEIERQFQQILETGKPVQ